MKKKKDTQKIELFEILNELFEAFKPDIDLRGYANFLLYLIEKHFGFKKAILQLISKQHNELYITASRGLSEAFTDVWGVTEFGSRISGKVARDGKGVIVADLMSDEDTGFLGEIYRKEGLRSLCSVRLVTKDAIIGALTVYGNAPHEFTRANLDLINSVASYAATFLNFIEQKDTIKDQLERLQKYNKKLEELQSFHELIIENIPIGVIATNEKGYVIFMNKGLEKMSLQKKEECLGKRWFEVFGFEGETKHRLETSYRTSAPQLFPEISLPLKNGSIQLVEMKTDIIKDNEDNRRGVVAICSDITEKKKMEREIEKVERLSAIGKLTAGIAHEIRNPLAGISGTLQVVKDKFKGDPDLEQIFNQLFGEINRLDRVVEKLYWLTAPKKLVFDVHSISELVEDSLFFLQKPLQSRGIRLIKKLARYLKPIMLDKDAIQQVILNVIINAMNAMPKGGDLTIETTQVENLDAFNHDIVWHPSNYFDPSLLIEKAFAPCLAIIITDTGIGIPTSDILRIFEAFFSSFRGGTGLGLYTSAKVIEQHQGMIGVRSQSGEGSAFFILLPTKDK